MAKATTASATAAEKDAEKVQAVENTTTEEKAVKTANTQSETVKLIYIIDSSNMYRYYILFFWHNWIRI